MSRFTQLTSEQRSQIQSLLEKDENQTKIAKTMGVDKSTISREIRRNSGKNGYQPVQAQQLSDDRKQGKYKGCFVASDWALVESLLREEQWSPENISLWLKSLQFLKISHQTIYQYIQRDKENGGDLYTFLIERRKK